MMGATIPPYGIKCAHCEEVWTINNCDDMVGVSGSEYLSGGEFEGLTIGEIEDELGLRQDAEYFVNSIQNDQFIDLSPAYPGAEENWKKEIVKNETGWVDPKELPHLYRVGESDKLEVVVQRYYHKACMSEKNENKAYREFYDVFSKAGFRDINLETIPNEYWGDRESSWCTPWFNVDTEIGKIKIGWRKRVISIDWSELPEYYRIKELFKDEDVTLTNKLVHAWGYEKAVEYLSKIHDLLTGRYNGNTGRETTG
jgi:hypothetical protein